MGQREENSEIRDVGSNKGNDAGRKVPQRWKEWMSQLSRKEKRQTNDKIELWSPT